MTCNNKKCLPEQYYLCPCKLEWSNVNLLHLQIQNMYYFQKGRLHNWQQLETELPNNNNNKNNIFAIFYKLTGAANSITTCTRSILGSAFV